jgi:hypothetical protein
LPFSRIQLLDGARSHSTAAGRLKALRDAAPRVRELLQRRGKPDFVVSCDLILAAGQLGAAHAKGAGADDHPASRGDQRRDASDRSDHHLRHRGQRARASVPARRVYLMLTRGEACVDQGRKRCEDQKRQRSVAVRKRRAEALSFQLNPVGTAA